MLRRQAIDEQVVHERALRRQQAGILRLADLRASTASLRRDALDGGQRVLAGDLDLAHVADVEQAGARAHGHVLVGDAGVFDRHVPAAERHHLRAGGAVAGVERRLLERSCRWPVPWRGCSVTEQVTVLCAFRTVNKCAARFGLPSCTWHVPGRVGRVPCRVGRVPCRSGRVPGCTWHVPGRSGHVPGCTWHVPGRSGRVPGCTWHVPDRSGRVPGCTWHVPGRSGRSRSHLARSRSIRTRSQSHLAHSRSIRRRSRLHLARSRSIRRCSGCTWHVPGPDAFPAGRENIIFRPSCITTLVSIYSSRSDH